MAQQFALTIPGAELLGDTIPRAELLGSWGKATMELSHVSWPSMANPTAQCEQQHPFASNLTPSHGGIRWLNQS